MPMDTICAKFDGAPGELAAEYYAQRASVGLIVTEARIGGQPETRTSSSPGGSCITSPRGQQRARRLDQANASVPMNRLIVNPMLVRIAIR
jgi:2,4-dienoyl-CoA reductase-like NADH-dependent reductase (Old Yellow Enzyme family)